MWQTYVSQVPALRQTGESWYLQSNGTVNNRLANTTYDAMGNQTQLSVSAGTVASYDGENRMSKIAVGGAEIASYTYDAEGRRVAKTANGTTTYSFYDAAGQLMAEYGGPAQTAATHYFTTDYLGSTRMILNGTGGCLDRLDYAPFGNQMSRSGYDCYGGAASEKPLFTGQMRDGESTAGTDTGQDYFNARYFWGNTARFTSPDAPFADQRPEDGQSWNMYAYVRNNPLRYVDPNGRGFCSIGEGANNASSQNKDEAACSTANGTWVHLPGDLNSDWTAPAFQFSTGVTERTGQLNPTAQSLFADNAQLWNTTGVVVNTMAVSTAVVMSAGLALEAAGTIQSLPTMEVAVGRMVDSTHVAFRATGGPWLHGLRFGGTGVEIIETGAANFAQRAFQFSVKILYPTAVTGMAGSTASNCLYGTCNAFLKGWGLK